MGARIVFVGAGAMGSFIGAFLARAGEDVTLIDPWSEHVAAINSDGVRLGGTQGEDTVRVRALTLTGVQALVRERPVDIAFLCVKSYDTQWATAMIRPYLAPNGFIVSLQNCINEERIAAVAGWDRTVGCIASTIGVGLEGPGHVVRTWQPGGKAYTVFRVGEVHGRITPRVREVARLLSIVDSTEVTTDLWGERWSKLAANGMHNGLAAVTGQGHRGVYGSERLRRIALRLGGEAVKIGRALGFCVDSVRGIRADLLVRALDGDGAALAEAEAAVEKMITRATEAGTPSTAQDVAKGRRTEIDYINGEVVTRAAAIGLAAPTHAALVALVRRVAAGEIAPAPENAAQL